MPKAKLKTGAIIDYFVTGKGEPILILHGFMGTPATELKNIINELSKKFLVIAPTYRGYGNSEPKPRKFPNDFYQIDAKDMFAFIEYLKLKKLHLLGFSDGGEISLIMAGTKPELFKSVIVWGAIGFVGPNVKNEAEKYYPATWVTDEIKARHGIKDANPMVRQWVDALKYLSESGGDLSISLSKNNTSPLLMMLGSKDYLNPPEYAAKVLVNAENSRLRMFKCGHRIHDELPNVFLKVVLEFLQRYKIKNLTTKKSLSFFIPKNSIVPSIALGSISFLARRKEKIKKNEERDKWKI